MLLNIGFAVTVVVPSLLLLVAFGVSWYGDHLASAGSVNGQTITQGRVTASSSRSTRSATTTSSAASARC